jgi:hypothetical protein
MGGLADRWTARDKQDTHLPPLPSYIKKPLVHRTTCAQKVKGLFFLIGVSVDVAQPKTTWQVPYAAMSAGKWM